MLGTVERSGRQLVLADIPGLIEGASAGAGLGHEFLAHVERTRLLVHVLDLAPLDGSDPTDSFATVEAELERHDPRLAGLPRILALSKADLVAADEAQETAERWRERLAGGVPVVVTSSATGQGLDELVHEAFRRMPEEAPAVAAAPAPDLAEHRVFRPAADRGWHVERAPEGGLRVAGKGIERLLARHDLDNEEALAYIEHRLRGLGVIEALRAHGFRAGDEVDIAGVAFELDPE